jgi:hypothetical protein
MKINVLKRMTAFLAATRVIRQFLTWFSQRPSLVYDFRLLVYNATSLTGEFTNCW